MSQQAPPAQPAVSDPVGDVAVAVMKVLLGAAVILVALPLVVPAVVLALIPPGAATKTRYWIVPRGWTAAVWGGPAVVAVLAAAEAVAAVRWLQADPQLPASVLAWPAAIWPHLWPWLVVNLAAGVLLVPAVFAARRRRTARQVQDRRIPDVVTQERIESARKHAADHTAARRIGVTLDARTGQIRHVAGHARHAPHPVDGAPAFGVVATATVRTVTERLRDRRQVRDWVSRDGRWLQLPATAGAVRALLVAESGSGKTVLLSGLIGSALARGWPVVFIDAKGDPADAAELTGRARAAGYTATVATSWDLFAGSSAQIVEKLMRLLPAPDGANQHYLDEARAVLAAIQGAAPVRSVQDLAARLADPSAHVRDTADRDLVTAVVEPRSGLTAAARVGRALSAALRPLEGRLDAGGWSYRRLEHALTVVPLSPADAAQARLGDLMLLDLRHALAARLADGNKTPIVVVVDEFAQLVGDGTDPGDTAAALYETARSAGAGLVLAAQSPAGLSGDDTRRTRALSSGAALILGRSKDPEDVVRYAGTVMRMESSGAAAGEELRSARAQHTWVIPPQDVREAWDGAFWLIQGGAIAAFRALPPRPVTAAPPAEHQPPQDRSPMPAAPAEPASELLLPDPAAGPARPAARVRRPTGRRQGHDPVPQPALVDVLPAPGTASPVTGLEIEVVHHGGGSWLATAYPATDDVVLNDTIDLDRVAFLSEHHPLEARTGSWRSPWHPDYPDIADQPLPADWQHALDRLVSRARIHWQL